MKIDATEYEKIFSSLITGLSSFVLNNTEHFHNHLKELYEKIEKLEKENTELKKQTEKQDK